jgi:hypothetical protein
MTEDRGAFKTKQPFQRCIRPICDSSNARFFTGSGLNMKFLLVRTWRRATTASCGGKVTGAFRFQAANEI